MKYSRRIVLLCALTLLPAVSSAKSWSDVEKIATKFAEDGQQLPKQQLATAVHIDPSLADFVSCEIRRDHGIPTSVNCIGRNVNLRDRLGNYIEARPYTCYPSNAAPACYSPQAPYFGLQITYFNYAYSNEVRCRVFFNAIHAGSIYQDKNYHEFHVAITGPSYPGLDMKIYLPLINYKDNPTQPYMELAHPCLF